MSAAPRLPPELDPKQYKVDAKGKIQHVSLIKPVDLARDELVAQLCERAKATAAIVAAFRRAAMGDVHAFAALSAEEYGAKMPAKGNYTLFTFDGRYKIIHATAERLTFDERLQAAKTLIDECIREWSAGADEKLVALVTDAFQVDKDCEISTSRVLALKRFDMKHPKWTEAMRAIDDSIHHAESKSYLRFYERNDEGEYEPISLDFSKAGGGSR